MNKSIILYGLFFLFTLSSCESTWSRLVSSQTFINCVFGIKQIKPISDKKFQKASKKYQFDNFTNFILKSDGFDSLIRGVKKYEFPTLHVFDNQGNLLIPNFEKPVGCSPMISFKEIYFSQDSLTKGYFNYEFDTRKYISNPDTISFFDIVKYLHTIDGNKVDSIQLHPKKTILVSWARWVGRYNKRIKRQFLNPLKDIPKEEYDIYLINFDLHKKFDKGFRFDWM